MNNSKTEIEQLLWKDQLPSDNSKIRLLVFILLALVSAFLLLVPFGILIILCILFQEYGRLLEMLFYEGIIAIIVVAMWVFVKIAFGWKPIEITTKGIRFSRLLKRDEIKKEEIKSLTIGKYKEISSTGKNMEFFANAASFVPSWRVSSSASQLKEAVEKQAIKIETEKETIEIGIYDTEGMAKALEQIGIETTKNGNQLVFKKNQ